MALRFYSIIMAFLVAVTATLPAHAQMTCDRVHSNLNPYSLEARVERSAVKAEKDREDFISHVVNGGAIHLNDRALAPKDTAAVMELVRMIAATRSVKFSYKAFIGKEFGEIILGFPLKNRYSLEITYKSDYRDGVKIFTADKVTLITPSGHADIAQKNVQTIEGGLIDKLNIDLSDYPGIADNNFRIHIPSEITGNALELFESKIAKKLDLLDKNDLWKIAQSNSYAKMKALINYRAFMAMMKDYHIKGVFKTYVKWVAVPLFGGLMLWQANTHMPNQMHSARLTIQNLITGPQTPWLRSSLDQFMMADHVPVPVKTQIKELQVEFDRNASQSQAIAALNRQFPPNLNFPGKFQLSKDQYMWVTKEFDQSKGRDVTLLFITQDNKFGQIEYAVAEIDPTKYSSLIKFLESKGQFLPLQEVK